MYHENQHVQQFRQGRWLKSEGVAAHWLKNPYAAYDLEYGPYARTAKFLRTLAAYERCHGDSDLAVKLLQEAQFQQEEADWLQQEINAFNTARTKGARY